ncbi:MAG: nucleotide-binding universal stress UspA family protein [Lentimonas sp.]|jgi:nucleotide-binding universal stress UspA family protein
MKKLLICTDGSNYAQECCRYGAWLAKRTGATVEILYVTDLRQFEIPVMGDLSGSLGIQPYEGMITQLRELEEQKSKFVKESAIKIFKAEGLMDRTQFYHETGLLVDSIDEYASRADLILLGKRGENANFAKEHLGSMLERVIRAMDKPCLVTSRKFEPINRALIAYDGGKSSRAALEFITKSELFRSFNLHVVAVDEKHNEGQAAAWLAEAEEILKKSEISPECQVLNGNVETAVADYVDQAEVDLLIAGAYGHSRIRKLLIGSTTSELLRRCHIPVLCFR